MADSVGVSRTATAGEAGVTAGDAVVRPIVAPPGGSPALASRPDQELDHGYHAYHENPAPWWIALLWISFLVGGAIYLVRFVVLQ